MDEPQYRLSRILTETYATPPSPGWRVEPPGNSNPRQTRQRFDSFRALAQASLAQASKANESPARRTSPNLACRTPFGLPLYGVCQIPSTLIPEATMRSLGEAILKFALRIVRRWRDSEPLHPVEKSYVSGRARGRAARIAQPTIGSLAGGENLLANLVFEGGLEMSGGNGSLFSGAAEWKSLSVD